MSTKHTPTPWKVDKDRYGNLPVIRNAEGEVFWQLAIVNGGTANPKPIDHENAAFIVRAVNAHEELVAVLETLVNQFGDQGYTVVAMAEKALAKAKGDA